MQNPKSIFAPSTTCDALFANARKKPGDPPAPYDCICLLSGGKDSTYMLARLVDLGVKVLAYTLDNGYISPEAKGNIQRVVDELGVDHVFGSTPVMNEIFVDSLQRFSNVCQGCFKTIYTLSMKLANEKNIPFIATGLSRGQFFETRLTEELFVDPNFDPAKIDATILRARKEYHRVDDAVSRLMDVSLFKDDRLFEQVQFVDFYRYCDVELAEMYTYLDELLPWIRPTDTGRSTNCLINDVGIHIHKKDRGFHNYAFPYSWDVRVGHKQRDAALAELDDEIDVTEVNRILDEIGYTPLPKTLEPEEQRLVAYYLAPQPIPHAELVATASAELPAFLVPTHFVHLDEFPLTPNGKVDRTALPNIGQDRPDLEQAYLAPRNPTEIALAKIWEEVLRVEQVGVQDNFFDLGGDSIAAIQIIARANGAGLLLTPSQLFDTLTVEKLAEVAGTTTVQAEQGPVSDSMPLMPIQHWYLEHAITDVPSLLCQVLCANSSQPLDLETFSDALHATIQHHDALCLSFQKNNEGWLATHREAPIANVPVIRSTSNKDQLIAELAQQLDPANGQLMAAAESADNEWVFVAHHLAIDAASWPILLEDLFLAYDQLRTGQSVDLPLKTTSFKKWSEALSVQTITGPLQQEISFWKEELRPGAADIPFDENADLPDRAEDTLDETIILDAETTRQLLENFPAKNLRIEGTLLTALACALNEWTGRDDIQIDIEGHGREELDKALNISRTVGRFTSLYPVTLQLPPGDNRSLAEAIGLVSDCLRRTPHHGRSFNNLRYGASSLASYPRSPILFNYLGQTEQLLPPNSPLAAQNPLSIYREPSMIRTHPLEMIAQCHGKELHVSLTYNTKRHHLATIQQLTKTFEQSIKHLITECLEGTTKKRFAAEFPQANLDQAKLKKLSSVLGKLDAKNKDHR